METEKRIGDFRVNRKVSWGITFPQQLHNWGLVQNPKLRSLCPGFVHSFSIELRPRFAQPPDPIQEALDRLRVLVMEPVVSLWPRGAWMDRQVRAYDYLFHIP